MSQAHRRKSRWVKRVLTLPLRVKWLGGISGNVTLPLWEHAPHIAGLSWEPSWTESSLHGLALTNCKADVCFGEINICPSALLSKISREDVRFFRLNLEANLLVDPRTNMSIASLSSCLMRKDASLGDIWCGGGRVSSAPLELRSHSAWWKQQNVAHYLGANTSSCLELNPGTAMRAEECLTGGQGPSTDNLAGMHGTPTLCQLSCSWSAWHKNQPSHLHL